MDYLAGMNDRQRDEFRNLRRMQPNHNWRFEGVVSNGRARLTAAVKAGSKKFRTWYMTEDGSIVSR